MEQAEEIKQMIESASNGYWFPLVTVAAVFGIVILLLLYIWNQMLKQNEKRHADHEKRSEKQDILLERVTDNLTELTIIVTELKTENKFLKK